MSTEEERALLYQSELRATEVITTRESAQLAARRHSVFREHEPASSFAFQKCWPLAMSCSVLVALWFTSAPLVEDIPARLSSNEVSGFIDGGSSPKPSEVSFVFDENWELYDDWDFYEWLAEEQLAAVF